MQCFRICSTTKVVGAGIVEGGWIGAHARSVYGSADIGTAYSPPTSQNGTHDHAERQTRKQAMVETVLDVAHRSSVSLQWILVVFVAPPHKSFVGMARSM